MMNHQHSDFQKQRKIPGHDTSTDMATEDLYDDIERKTKRRRIIIGVGVLVILVLIIAITVPLILMSKSNNVYPEPVV